VLDPAQPISEVVLATNPTTTGEATALHIADVLRERAPDVIVTYRNFGKLTVWGSDLAAELLLDDRFSVAGTLSHVSKDFFPRSEIGGVQDISLNAPASKGSITGRFNDEPMGMSAELRDVLADIEARGRRAVLVGGTGLYLRAVVDDLTIPGQYPDVWAELDREPDTTALHARLAQLDPLAASRMEPTNRRRVVRALEVSIGSGRPFSSFGPGLDAYPPTRFALVGIELDPDVVAARIEARFRQQVADGFVAEVEALSAKPLSRTAAQALGYKELLAHVRGERPLDDALDEAIRRTRRFARRQRSWFRRDPRIQWVTGDETLPSLEATLTRHTGR